MDLPKQTPIRNAPGAKSLLGKAVDTSAKIVQLSGESRRVSPNDNGESKPKLPLPMLEKLWLKMAEMYGHRWTSSFGELADPNHSWATVLAGLDRFQLAAGMSALVERGQEFDWPPPANVFRSLCLQMPGFPPEAQAWIEALAGKYSHEAVRVAAEQTGLFELRTAKPSNKLVRQHFERNYAIVLRRAQNAQPLDGKIPAGIGHDSQKSELELAMEHADWRQNQIIAAQNIPTDPKAARALLLAKMGIRRDNHA